MCLIIPLCALVFLSLLFVAMDVAAETRTEPNEQTENGNQVIEVLTETKEEKNVEIAEKYDWSPRRARTIPNGLMVMV